MKIKTILRFAPKGGPKIWKSGWQICFASTLIYAFSLGSSRAAEVSSAAKADFDWFSSLGFPEVAGCPFVRIATGRWSQAGGEPPQNGYVNGFLLTTQGPAFRFLTVDVVEETLTNSWDGTNDYKRMGFAELNLKEEAEKAHGALTNLPPIDEYWLRYQKGVTRQTETFVLAWACWRQGLGAQAQELYAALQKVPERGQSVLTNGSRGALETDLAAAMMWRAAAAFGDLSVSRAQLLARYDAMATNYPHSEYREQVVQTAAVLRRMILEEETHARTMSTNLSQRSVEAQVKELIFRLRDQNGHQWTQPGDCDIFEGAYYGRTNTAADQLVRLGYAAVPQLIAAMDDPTLTRAVGLGRGLAHADTMLTVGDCAVAILQRITGKSFIVFNAASANLTKEERAIAARKAADLWWTEFQKKGERQMLVEALSSPDNDTPAEANLLCQRYPEVAVPVMISGIQATTNDWIRSQLVQRLGEIHTPEVIGFLREEMTNSPVRQSRIAAAYGLRRTDKKGAMDAVIQEWQKLGPVTPYYEDNLSDIIDFLASCDSPEAIQALAKDLGQRSVETRLAIVEAADSNWLPTVVSNSPATQAAIEALLVKELEDTDERFGMSGTRNLKSFNDPRVCDIAGENLAERFTNRYTFDLNGSLMVRERQRIECLNVWRAAHGQPALPMPERSTMHVSPAKATTVTTIEWEEVKTGGEFAGAVMAVKDQPLEPARIVGLLMRYLSTPELQAGGLEFRAIKDEDLTGVRLIVKLLAGRTSASDGVCKVAEHVTLGRKGLDGMSGVGGKDFYLQAGGWSALADAMTKAIAGAPETPFEIAVEIRLAESQ